MANNPYHDETGKFCSKNDMQGAIARLAKAGDFEAYFKLRTELENIETKKVTVSKDFMTKITRSGLNIFDRSNTLSAEDINEVYSTVDYADSSTIPSKLMLLNLVEGNTTPKEVKDDILANAPMEVKLLIAESGANNRSPLLGADLQKLVAGETNSWLVKQVLHTEKLTFEDKYNMVRASNTELSTLANFHSKEFFSVPELEQELLAEAQTLGQATNPVSSIHAYNLLSTHSKNSATHAAVIDAIKSWHGDGGDAVISPYKLAENPNLSAVNAINLYEAALKNNIRDVPMVTRSLARNRSSEAYQVFKRVDLRDPYNPTPFNERTPTHVAQNMNQIQFPDSRGGNNAPAASRWGYLKTTSVEAEYNSYKENYDGLVSRLKAARKRNAPMVNSFRESLEGLEEKKVYADAYIDGMRTLDEVKTEYYRLIE